MSHGAAAAVTDQLARRLGTRSAVMIGLGSMMGAGVFAACNALSSAQLAAVHPTSGSTYVYGRERLGPWWGYLAGWGFVVVVLAALAVLVGASTAGGADVGRIGLGGVLDASPYAIL